MKIDTLHMFSGHLMLPDSVISRSDLPVINTFNKRPGIYIA